MFEREINWLVNRLLEEYPHLKNTARDFLTARIIWGIPKGFTYFWTDSFGPYGGIIIRPVNADLILHGLYDYWETFWKFDPGGDVLWVDFAYGPGLYPQFIALCRSTGCAQLGWRHRDRTHIAPMEQMPAHGMKMAFH